MADRPHVITGMEFAAALAAAGIIPDPSTVRRIVIDVRDAMEPPAVHVELFGDERLLDVVRTLDGIEVRTGQPAAVAAGSDTEGAT